MTVEFLSKDNICNLSRIPVDMNNNPIYKTVSQLQKNIHIKTRDTELFKHYESYNPRTLFDIYGVVEKLKKFPCSNIFLPWIHKKPVDEFVDIAFLYRDEDFIEKQTTKIKNLTDSIESLGYTPEEFPDRKGGHITGYWLRHKKNEKFYVCSGNHRVSVCFSLNGKAKVPFSYENINHLKQRDLVNRRKDILKLYDTKDVSNWPSVASGFLEETEAIAITNVYFEGKNE